MNCLPISFLTPITSTLFIQQINTVAVASVVFLSLLTIWKQEGGELTFTEYSYYALSTE